MDGHESGEIEELVAEALARIEVEGPQALEDLCRQHPSSADALRLRVEWLLETGLVGPELHEPRSYPEQLGDYRLIEPIGHGGMGVVYRAEQLSLGREVALKLVRPEQLYFPGALDRFEHEVATVAGLAHPGIVPVFAVGQERGVPFFAMEHVRGASLGAVVASLAGRDPRTLTGADLLEALDALGADADEEPSTLFDGPWPTVCARMIREAAEALEHAHRRGVLHRDVKPSNIMVTRGGRVMLLDFGLSSRESPGDRRTKTGHRVGTLAYMAPEQLRGERELDAGTDVFALGVTLYELLTLRLPYDASSESARLTRVDRTLPADLRKTDPRVPWELETVVQTAAAPERARRYATAADLARDLGNVLENRPIEARRASPLRRAQRWAQREPARAAGAGLAAVLLVGGPLVYAGLAYVAREGLRSAYEREGEERRRAEDSLQDAIAAIDEIVLQGSDQEFAARPGADPARRRLLERAVQLYENLLAREEGNEALVERSVWAWIRLSELHRELGDLDAAVAAAESALTAIDECPTAGMQHRDGLRWEAEFTRLTAEYARGNLETFLAGYAALSEAPDLPGAVHLARQRLTRAILASLVANALQSEGDHAGAMAAADAAVTGCEQLREQDPDNVRILSELGMALQGRAYFAAFGGGPNGYEEDFERSVELLERSIELEPTRPVHRLRLATTLSKWAHADILHGALAAAGERAVRAHDLLADLVVEFPLRETYAVNHLANFQRLSWSRRLGGDQPAAEAVLEEGVSFGRAALQRIPESDTITFHVAMIAAELARLYGERGAFERADELWPLARDMWTRLLEAPSPKLPHMIQAGTFYDNLARYQLARGELAAAEQSAHTAVGWHDRMLQRTGSEEHTTRLGYSLPLVARIQVARGSPDEAVATLADGVERGALDREDLCHEELTRALGERDDYRALLEQLARRSPE